MLRNWKKWLWRYMSSILSGIVKLKKIILNMRLDRTRFIKSWVILILSAYMILSKSMRIPSAQCCSIAKVQISATTSRSIKKYHKDRQNSSSGKSPVLFAISMNFPTRSFIMTWNLRTFSSIKDGSKSLTSAYAKPQRKIQLNSPLKVWELIGICHLNVFVSRRARSFPLRLMCGA